MPSMRAHLEIAQIYIACVMDRHGKDAPLQEDTTSVFDLRRLSHVTLSAKRFRKRLCLGIQAWSELGTLFLSSFPFVSVCCPASQRLGVDDQFLLRFILHIFASIFFLFFTHPH